MRVHATTLPDSLHLTGSPYLQLPAMAVSVALALLLSDIIRQAALATNMSKIYFTNRGPPSVLDSIALLTGDTSDQYAFSMHLSSDLYPENMLARSILRGYETVRHPSCHACVASSIHLFR